MKKLFRGLTAAVTLFFLILYASPSVQELNRTPQTVSEWTLSDTTLLSSDAGATAVRRTGDERLSPAAHKVTVRLFGLIPLKTVTVAEARGELAVCGDAIGIEMRTLGVQVVGFGSVLTDAGEDSPAAAAGLKQGDAILTVNGTPVTDSLQFSELVGAGGEVLTLTLLREGETLTARISPAVERGTREPRIGAWVRDSTSGIGTLSAVDPVTGRFAALGHAVTDVDTGALLPAASGTVTAARVTDVRRGKAGTPGELCGVFGSNVTRNIGSIDVNTVFGIAGQVHADALLARTCVPVAATEEVTQGDAVLYATVDDSGVQAFSCRVIRLEVQASPMTQGMMIEVTDEGLLSATGGIVQGMSGSPIVQNGKFIGVVTHVFVNDPTRGFCLYAEWMAEKLL